MAARARRRDRPWPGKGGPPGGHRKRGLDLGCGAGVGNVVPPRLAPRRDDEPVLPATAGGHDELSTRRRFVDRQRASSPRPLPQNRTRESGGNSEVLGRNRQAARPVKAQPVGSQTRRGSGFRLRSLAGTPPVSICAPQHRARSQRRTSARHSFISQARLFQIQLLGSQVPQSEEASTGLRNVSTAAVTSGRAFQARSSFSAMVAYGAAQNSGGGGTPVGIVWVPRNSKVSSIARRSSAPSIGPVVAGKARSGRSRTASSASVGAS